MRVLLLLLVSWSAGTAAAEVRANSCSRQDVQAAVNLAAADDEVVIPAGSCTWLTQLDIVRPVVLRGEGQSATVLRDGVTKNGTATSRLLRVALSPGERFRITALTIEGLAPDPMVYTRGHVAITSAKDWRVDHVEFRALETVGVTVSGSSTGLIDHCTFDSSGNSAVFLTHDEWDGGSYGDSSWASASTLGTTEALVIEDCAFAGAGQAVVFANAGARLAFRHCSVVDDIVYVEGLGTAARERGARHVEIYANTFVAAALMGHSAVEISGGTGVIFDNQISGSYRSAVDVDVRRTHGSFTPWGACNGSNGFDQNAESGGYPCLDMIGRGAGALLSGVSPMPVAWPSETLEPLHLWNNTVDGGPLLSNAAPAFIVAGRDYVVGTARPGYTPLPYPHPLLSGSDSGSGGGGMPPDADLPRWARVECSCDASGLGASVGALLVWCLAQSRRR